jgi:hypothetical protein
VKEEFLIIQNDFVCAFNWFDHNEYYFLRYCLNYLSFLPLRSFFPPFFLYPFPFFFLRYSLPPFFPPSIPLTLLLPFLPFSLPPSTSQFSYQMMFDFICCEDSPANALTCSEMSPPPHTVLLGERLRHIQ